MGPGGVAGDGILADGITRIVLRHFAAGIHVWLSFRGTGLRNCVSNLSFRQLENTIRYRSLAGFSGPLYPNARPGIAHVVTAKRIDNQFLVKSHRNPETALAALFLRDSAHDGVQRDVARDTGPISNVSDGARPEREGEVWYWDHLRDRRNLWRSDRRPFIATIWQTARYYLSGDWRTAAYPALGFSVRNYATSDRRIRHAVHGARRMGNRAGAFERAFAGGTAGNVSRICLSTWQFAR